MFVDLCLFCYFSSSGNKTLCQISRYRIHIVIELKRSRVRISHNGVTERLIASQYRGKLKTFRLDFK